LYYKIEEQPPAANAEIACREKLLAVVEDVTEEYGLEMEPFTAWQEVEPERVQGVFLNTSTASGPLCVGAIVRRNNGELRLWPRNDSTGPIRGSNVIKASEIESAILEMVEQFTAA
jgi:hypothetical protein